MEIRVRCKAQSNLDPACNPTKVLCSALGYDLGLSLSTLYIKGKDSICAKYNNAKVRTPWRNLNLQEGFLWHSHPLVMLGEWELVEDRDYEVTETDELYRAPGEYLICFTHFFWIKTANLGIILWNWLKNKTKNPTSNWWDFTTVQIQHLGLCRKLKAWSNARESLWKNSHWLQKTLDWDDGVQPPTHGQAMVLQYSYSMVTVSTSGLEPQDLCGESGSRADSLSLFLFVLAVLGTNQDPDLAVLGTI